MLRFIPPKVALSAFSVLPPAAFPLSDGFPCMSPSTSSKSSIVVRDSGWLEISTCTRQPMLRHYDEI